MRRGKGRKGEELAQVLHYKKEHWQCRNSSLQCFDTVGWVAGRASGL